MNFLGAIFFPKETLDLSTNDKQKMIVIGYFARPYLISHKECSLQGKGYVGLIVAP